MSLPVTGGDGQGRPWPQPHTLHTRSHRVALYSRHLGDDTISRTKTTLTNPTKTNSRVRREEQPSAESGKGGWEESGIAGARAWVCWARGRRGPCPRPRAPQDPRAAQPDRVPRRALAVLHVPLEPFSRAPPSAPHGPRARTHTHRRADSRHTAPPSRPRHESRSAPLPSPPPPPSPQAPGQPRAGRGGAGAGAGRGGGRRRPKRRSRRAEGPELCAVPTAPPRQPAGTRTPRSPSSSPGLARPPAMEFLWAPLLGLCCSLAAADRHTVFWNSSNPK